MSPQAAAWFCDLSALYVSAIGYEESLWIQRENSTKSGEEADHEALDAEMVAFFEDLPPDVFPLMSRYITEMTNGDGDERFEFGLDVLISGLAAVSDKYR